MYFRIFTVFPKKAFSRLMGWFAGVRWPGWLLTPLIRIYIFAFRIDMAQFEGLPGEFPTFNRFFTRPLRPGARPLPEDPHALISPVDGTVLLGHAIEGTGRQNTEAGASEGVNDHGMLIQAKGINYTVRELLGGVEGWEAYLGGHALTIYLSPKDYHRIHTPCAGTVRRFAYHPGDLWTVSPAGVNSVPGLFARNERIVSYIETAFGEMALVAVGATVVGSVNMRYTHLRTNRLFARPTTETLATPLALKRGEELGQFELGSTVILLSRPGETEFQALEPGTPLKLGQVIGKTLGAGAANESRSST